jgi:hypothetical protein
VEAVCAFDAAVSAWCSVPLRVIVPRPVIEEPGERPRSPLRVVASVFVTVVAPKTAKLSTAPRSTAIASAYTGVVALKNKAGFKTTRGMKISSNTKTKAVNFPTFIFFSVAKLYLVYFHYCINQKLFI